MIAHVCHDLTAQRAPPPFVVVTLSLKYLWYPPIFQLCNTTTETTVSAKHLVLARSLRAQRVIALFPVLFFLRVSLFLSFFYFPPNFSPWCQRLDSLYSDWNHHHYSFYLIHLPWRVACAYKDAWQSWREPDCEYDVDKHDVWFVVRSNYVFERWEIKGH